MLRLLRLFWLSLGPRRAELARRAPEVASAMLGGVVAAGLGLGVFAVVVLFLWITSPYADSGPNAALHVAAALWLLAHGADLLRTDALTGATVPIGVTPLLLTALPAWLVYRATAHAVDAAEEARAAVRAVADGVSGASGVFGVSGEPGESDEEEPLGPVAVAGWFVAGYLLVAFVAVLVTMNGTLRSSPPSALLFVPLLAVVAAGAGVGTSRLRLPVSREILDDALGGALGVAVRASVVGVAVLIAGGALLTAVAMLWHGLAAGESIVRLSRSVSDRFAVLLLAAALTPNAAVWAASYALGPGFSVGVGSVVSPTGAHGYPARIPDFPLLTALPAPTGHVAATPVTWLGWLVLAVPFASGTVVAWYVADRADLHRWTVRRTAAAAALGSVGCGVLTTLVTLYAAGPMGTGMLADFGPTGWRTGAAALGWTALVAVPGAVGASLWRLHGPRPAPAARARVKHPPEPPADSPPQAGVQAMPAPRTAGHASDNAADNASESVDAQS